MPTRTTTTDLVDFGIGMLMGLVRSGQINLNEQRLVAVHQGFVTAFRVVENELGQKELSFWMTTDKFHGTSPDVDKIFNYWLSRGYATKDAPGTIYRFLISRSTADRKLETITGGAPLYDKAVEAYFGCLNSHYAS